VILTGRLGKDPDLRYTQSGKAVATFSLAVTDNYNREVTHWLNIVTWNKPIDDDALDFDPAKIEQMKVELETCTHCGGEGTKCNGLYTFTCPVCHGTGEVPKGERK